MQFTPQTGLHASNAKSFAMKLTLSEQVRAYIAARGDGYTPARLAADVARLQTDLPEEKRCKRQNIEQLLESDFRTVRYVIQLATAMGTTAEVLAAGRFQPGAIHANVSDGPKQNGPYPLISDVIAGDWAELCDNFHPGESDEKYMSTKNLGRHGYMLRVYGKSMENPGGRYSFPEGMILHVNPDMDPVPGQFVIVRRESTKEATFKKYVMIEGSPFLEAINPDWPRELKYLALQPGDVWCGVVMDASIGSLP